MVDDIEDFRNTMNTFDILEGDVENFEDYGAALSPIHWEGLSEVGRHSWQLAQQQIIEPTARHVFQHLNDVARRTHQDSPEKHAFPWSLTDPDFLFCRHQIMTGRDITPDEFQERFLNNLPQVDTIQERLNIIERTSGFLARGAPPDLAPSVFFVAGFPEHNRLTHVNVDWAEVRERLTLLQSVRPSVLELRYERDGIRRDYLRSQGLSSYYGLTVGPLG